MTSTSRSICQRTGCAHRYVCHKVQGQVSRVLWNNYLQFSLGSEQVRLGFRNPQGCFKWVIVQKKHDVDMRLGSTISSGFKTFSTLPATTTATNTTRIGKLLVWICGPAPLLFLNTCYQHRRSPSQLHSIECPWLTEALPAARAHRVSILSSPVSNDRTGNSSALKSMTSLSPTPSAMSGPTASSRRSGSSSRIPMGHSFQHSCLRMSTGMLHDHPSLYR